MKMHTDQVHVDVDTVGRLVSEQFPQWADLPVRALQTAATVNAIFRIGDDWQRDSRYACRPHPAPVPAWSRRPLLHGN